MSPRPLSTALQLFAAATLALGLAQSLGLTNPYWAAMPVWVVHQAWREDLLFRAGLRVLGTVLGAALALGLLALDLPGWGTAAVLALSVGTAAAAAFWIGTVMSYGAFMLGVTLFVVLLPALAGPGLDAGMSAQAAAVDRILCTLIGVATITAVTFPFTPRRSSPPPHRMMEGRRWAALRRGLFCAGMTLVASGLVMLWPRFDVLTGAMTLIVYPMILSTAPDPWPIRRALVPGVAIGTGAALCFLALGAPLRGGDPAQLFALTLAFLAAGALFRAWPRTAPLGLDANMCFLLAAEVGTWRHGLADATLAGAVLLAASAVVTLLAGPAIGSPAIGLPARRVG